MSSSERPEEVRVYVLGAGGSGQTTLLRRYLWDKFDSSYDPTLLVGPSCMLKTVADMQIIVGLERVPVHVCAVQDGKLLKENIKPAHAVLVVMTPAKPGAVDETIRLRLEVLGDAMESKDGLIEGVVIMKDPDVPWDISITGSTFPLKYYTPEEKRLAEKEWQKGAEKAYGVARMLGVEVTIACPRTGEGVKEAVDDLIIKVMERRKAEAERAKRFEEEKQFEEDRRGMPVWKRLLSKIRKEEKVGT